jgi:hypothetical protein
MRESAGADDACGGLAFGRQFFGHHEGRQMFGHVEQVDFQAPKQDRVTQGQTNDAPDNDF